MLWHYPFKMHKKCVGFHGNALLSLCLSVSVSLSLWWMILMVGGWLVMVLGLWIPTTRGVKGPPPGLVSSRIFMPFYAL